MELERKSSGVAKGGLATGIVGTALGSLALLGSGANTLTNAFGRNTAAEVVIPVPMGGCGWGHGGYDNCGCSENHVVNRYELAQEKEIAKLQSEIALRDANTFTDQKNLEMYRYVDGRLREIEQALAAQAVVNQKTTDDVARVQANLDCCCERLQTAICSEARERRCNDNAIVNYANNTFYAKLIADITPASTTTKQDVYNPLPQCDSCCGNN